MLSKLKSFVVSRWRGQVSFAVVFWRDMIAVGTVLNVLIGLLAFILYAAGAPFIVALIVFFALLPWNFFLFLAVWRSASQLAPSAALLARILAAVWLVAVIVI